MAMIRLPSGRVLDPARVVSIRVGFSTGEYEAAYNEGGSCVSTIERMFIDQVDYDYLVEVLVREPS